MTAYIFYSLFIPLTAVYVLFLFRLRQGLRYYAGNTDSYDDSTSSDDGSTGLDDGSTGSDDGSTGSDDGIDPDLPEATVIVAARNEQDNITACLISMLAQDYPAGRLEILVVDDHSDDDTADIAREVLRDVSNAAVLKLGDSPDAGEGEKAAITEGVRRARGEIIITTDADCRHNVRWLQTLLRSFSDDVAIVAGPVVLTGREKLFSRMQALEMTGLMAVSAGFSGIGYPRLCNGANLAYRKSCFNEVKGFQGNETVHSGDDEFLMQKIVYGLGRNDAYALDPEAVVDTAAATTLYAFLRQRVRWASKCTHYEDKRFVSFLILLFVYLLFAVIAPVIAFTSPVAMMVGLFLFAVKVSADMSLLLPAAGRLKQPVRFGDVFIAELLHAPYLVVVSIFGTIGSFKWKGRKLRNRRV